MNDTSLYKTLGVPETATRAELDAAYEVQMARFSEDNYLGSPLWDMAAERRQAIQTAYDQVTVCGETPPEPAKPAEQPKPPSLSTRVRKLLNDGSVEEAEFLLHTQPDRDTNPEWLYLRGVAAWKRGWLDEAYQHIKRAADTVPTNREYQTALENLRTGVRPGIKQNEKTRHRLFSGETCADCGCELCCGCLCENLCDALSGC